MSKRRPSARRPGRGSRPQSAGSLAAWQRRVFRNSYTRRGRTLRVRGWSVKLQHQGRRRTFSLKSRSRAMAAREAQSLCHGIRTRGWDSAPPAQNPGAVPGRRGPAAARLESDRSDARYWQERLIHSKYMDARPDRRKEFSARIEHDGIYQYFPLETDQEGPAAGRALAVYRTVLSQGWEEAFRRFPREITVAIFWSTSPVACTYTTLFTFPGQEPPTLTPPADADRSRLRILLVEPEPEVRRTLAFWLGRQPGFECAAAVADAVGAQERLDRAPPDLLLVNRALPGMPVGEFLDRLRRARPNLAAFAYGIYQDSDQIFINLSGVTAGYIFRRRKPHDLFEPLRAPLRQRALSAKEIFLLIRDYFQSLFGFAPPGEESPGLARLTVREQDILNHVSKGFLDKEIADALRISVWTVHNHLKHIYEKLNVHTRTEAVLKYLQK